MDDAIREKLISWRAEVAAEIAGLSAQIPAARQAITDADATWAAARARWHDLRDIVRGAIGTSPISGRVAARLHSEDPSSSEVASAPGITTRALEELEFQLSDARDALDQLDRALAGSWPTALLGREPPTVIVIGNSFFRKFWYSNLGGMVAGATVGLIYCSGLLYWRFRK
jgi:hypothetical protein